MSLWEKATALPLAQESDFYGSHRRPQGVDPQHLRIIKDTALRSRLIMAGMAEGLQSPKGPQKIASIIRLYADFNAPQPVRGAHDLEFVVVPSPRRLVELKDVVA